jgi:hypothetical protein
VMEKLSEKRRFIVIDSFCHDCARSVSLKDSGCVFHDENRIDVSVELGAKLSSSIGGDLAQGVIGCVRVTEKILDSSFAIGALDFLHITKWIVIQMPLYFNEDLY